MCYQLRGTWYLLVTASLARQETRAPSPPKLPVHPSVPMKIHHSQRLPWFITLLLAACVHAQAAKPDKRLEPLVVSADRTEGCALLEKDLHLFQIESVSDLEGVTPGLSIVTSDTRGYGDVIGMRGNANTLFFSPPAVGMVVDDVPMGDVSSYPTGLLQMDQVKVLRGPQGTLYGRNGAAGMIDMSTPHPGNTTETHLTSEFGSYGLWGSRLTTSGPLGEGFAQSFQFYHEERDGYIYNTTLGRATDDRSITGGLANLYWKPAEDTEWRLRVLTERADDGAQRLSLLGSGDPFKVASDIPGESVMERCQISLHGTKTGPWGTLKSITTWQDWRMDPSITDLNLTAIPLWSSRIVQDQTMWTQEFRWESPEDSTPWSWRTGAFFMKQLSSGDGTRDFTKYGWPLSERTIYDLDQWNAAAYGRVGYAVDTRLQVLAGLRVEHVDSQINRTKTNNYFVPPSHVNEETGAWYASPELGASYALNDSTRLFARSAIGVKPAGFSAFASTPAMASYDDEQAWTNEVGMEVTLPDPHLAFNLTGYWNHIHNYQMNIPDGVSTDYYTVNADQVTSMGVEAEAKWQPVDGWTLQGSVGYVNAIFNSYQDPVTPGMDYDGNKVPFVPEFTSALGARYDFTNGFYVQSAVRMIGETYFDEANSGDFRQGSYLCWDAEIGYVAKNFSVALFGRNLLDRNYYTYINPQITAGSPGDPQVFGVRASLDF